jgi:hypothetical protein
VTCEGLKSESAGVCLRAGDTNGIKKIRKVKFEQIGEGTCEGIL